MEVQHSLTSGEGASTGHGPGAGYFHHNLTDLLSDVLTVAGGRAVVYGGKQQD